MDYIAMSAAASMRGIKEVFRSYDIACQWKTKLPERVAKLPDAIHVPTQGLKMDFGVPKLHTKGHKYPCQCQYSMHVKKGTACTCSEGIKQTWSKQNKMASSTKEMGPGSRHNIIDDQLGKHNWGKVTKMGRHLVST